MHTAFVRLLTIAGTALLFAQGAVAGDDALKKEISARYDIMRGAIDNGDSKAMAALLAPGFLSVDVTGKSQTADQLVAGVGKLRADPHKESKTVIVSVTPTGDDAVDVVQTYSMRKTIATPDGSVNYLQMSAESSDKWVRVNGNWLCQTTATNMMNYVINGKLVMHKVRPLK